MRDNRNVAIMMLYELYKSKNYVFLLTLLNLDIANFKYSIKKVEIINHVVFAEFSKEESDVKYVNIQKMRKIRIALSSLNEYALKDNRNGFVYSNNAIERLKKECLNLLDARPEFIKNFDLNLDRIFASRNFSDLDVEKILIDIGNSSALKYEGFIKAKLLLNSIMKEVASKLSSEWNAPRYIEYN